MPPRPENQTAAPRIGSRNANCCHEAKPQFTPKIPLAKVTPKTKALFSCKYCTYDLSFIKQQKSVDFKGFDYNWSLRPQIPRDIHLLCLALSIGNESCASNSITVVCWCCRCFLLSLLALLLQRLDWPLYHVWTMNHEHTWSNLIHLHLHLCCAATLETLKKECFDQAFAVDSTSCDTSKFSVALLWTHSWPRAQDEGNQAELLKHV